MSNQFSSGKHSIAQCDRCAFRFKLSELVPQTVNQKVTGLKVCPACLDIDHEQLQLGKYPVSDPQAVREPRPDQRNDVATEPQLTGFTVAGVPIFT